MLKVVSANPLVFQLWTTGQFYRYFSWCCWNTSSCVGLWWGTSRWPWVRSHRPVVCASSSHDSCSHTDPSCTHCLACTPWVWTAWKQPRHSSPLPLGSGHCVTQPFHCLVCLSCYSTPAFWMGSRISITSLNYNYSSRLRHLSITF